MKVPRQSTCRALTRWAGGACVAVALLVLAGWAWDIDALKSVLPEWVSMKANTAVGILLAGLALVLMESGTPTARSELVMRRIARVCAALVLLIGALTLAEYLFGWNPGLDQLLFQEAPGVVATGAPGRMAPSNALAFLLLGIALQCLYSRRGYHTSQALALLVLLLAALNLAGYLFASETLIGLANYTRMAFHSAAAFLLLGLGMLCARPERGIISLFLGVGVGSTTARQLLPPLLVFLPATFWLELQGNKAGFYDLEFGVAGMAVLVTTFTSSLILLHARALNRMDGVRRRA